MKKKALLVGCTGGSLPEAMADAEYAARYMRMFDFDCKVVAEKLVEPQAWSILAEHLYGADIAWLAYSGHGFRQRLNGKVVTGIWSGVPITHASFEQFVLQPIRKHSGTLVRVYDCCYAGSTTAALSLESGDVHRVNTKCMGLCDDNAPLDIPHYKSVNEKDVILAACGARQSAYGRFDGGTPFEPWHSANTLGCSLFTFCLYPSLWMNRAAGFVKAANVTEWRGDALMKAFANGAGWLLQPPIKYPTPNVQARVPAGIPKNLLLQ